MSRGNILEEVLRTAESELDDVDHTPEQFVDELTTVLKRYEDEERVFEGYAVGEFDITTPAWWRYPETSTKINNVRVNCGAPGRKVHFGCRMNKVSEEE